jgi:hypothetical protein
MSNQIARTIREQIGHRALTMIGASTFLALESALAFKVGRNPKGASHVTVTLAPDDTYTVKSERFRMSRATMAVSCKLIAETSDIYAEQLCQAIEAVTGLYTSL